MSEKIFYRLPVEETPKDWLWLIPLSQGYSALVDQEDYETLLEYKWHVAKSPRTNYARRSTHIQERKDFFSLTGDSMPTHMAMHRFIKQYHGPLKVDHINGNGLDNRRANLRIGTGADNARNHGTTHGSSKYKGVHWFKRRGLWTASIGITESGKSRKQIIGYYDSEEDAGLAYDRKALELFGEFARVNFPGGDDGRDIHPPSRAKRGESQHLSKLTEEQVLEIRRRAALREPIQNIAKDFNIGVSTVSTIRHRHTWKHLADPQER